MTQLLAEADDYAEVRLRAITAIPLEVGPVSLGNGVLQFDPRVTSRVVPPRDLLARFLALRLANDRRILSFATRWGALTLCPHGSPLDLCNVAGCVPFRSSWWVRPQERPDDWRSWARRFAALTMLGRQLDDGKPWERELAAEGLDWSLDWRRWEDALVRPVDLGVEVRDATGRVEPRLAWAPPTDGVRRQCLATTLNHLLLGLRVRREVVRVRGRSWAIVDGSRWLCGVLVQQLAAEVVQVRSLAICAECGRGYRADRRTARYCEKCRATGVPLRRAQQARRDRLKARGKTSRNKRPRSR